MGHRAREAGRDPAEFRGAGWGVAGYDGRVLKGTLDEAYGNDGAGGLGPGRLRGQVVNAKDNPLLGTWVYTSGGIGGTDTCSKELVFEPHGQIIEFRGSMGPANAAHAVEEGNAYVEEHAGPGATKAFVIVNKNEIMSDIGVTRATGSGSRRVPRGWARGSRGAFEEANPFAARSGPIR